MCCALGDVRFVPNSGHCALHSIASLGLFDYIVGANVQRRRNVNAKGLRGPKIYDQFELTLAARREALKASLPPGESDRRKCRLDGKHLQYSFRS